MCTEEEIASFMGVTVETLHRDENGIAFLECVKKGREKGKASLRANQFRLAKSNPTMAIWLGKQYLAQKDIPNEDLGFNEDGTPRISGSNELKIVVEKRVIDLTNKKKEEQNANN